MLMSPVRDEFIVAPSGPPGLDASAPLSAKYPDIVLSQATINLLFKYTFWYAKSLLLAAQMSASSYAQRCLYGSYR